MKMTPIRIIAKAKENTIASSSWMAHNIEQVRKNWKLEHGIKCSHQFAGDAVRRAVAEGKL